MRRWKTLCMCILVLLAIPFAVTAALVEDENATAAPENETGKIGNMTVAGYIAQDKNLTRLAEALNVTGFNDTLNTEGPYTVFAPNDDAFDALGNETVDSLFNETTNLTEVLQYHTVEGEYTSENLTNMTKDHNKNESEDGVLGFFEGLFSSDNKTENMTTLKTLSGESLNVSVSDGKITVEGANVTQKEITATNGVIYTIDRVLLPPGMNLTVSENKTEPAATGIAM